MTEFEVLAAAERLIATKVLSGLFSQHYAEALVQGLFLSAPKQLSCLSKCEEAVAVDHVGDKQQNDIEKKPEIVSPSPSLCLA